MITRMTKTQYQHVVSKDFFRPAQHGILYEPEKGLLTATNGFICLQIEVDEVEDGDVECIIPLEAFNPSGIRRSTRRKLRLTFEDKDGGIEITTDVAPPNDEKQEPFALSRRLTRAIDDTFPNYLSVIEQARAGVTDQNRKGVRTIGLNMKLVDSMRRCLPGGWGNDILRIDVYDPNRATVVSSASVEADLKFLIILMPSQVMDGHTIFDL
jgi:hypothetical protein